MSDRIPYSASRVDGANRLITIVENLLLELHPDRGESPVEMRSILDRELGIDSLSRVELVLRIERDFSIQLPEDTFATAETVNDLLRAIQVAVPELAVSREKTTAVSVDQAGAPEHAVTLSEILRWHVERHPDRLHIRFLQSGQPDQVITYGQLYDNALQIAAALQQRGINSGDRVAIMLPSGESYFNAFFGIILAGAIPVPIYPPVRRHQLVDHLKRQTRILENCRPRILITLAEAKTLAHLLQVQVTGLAHVVTAEDLLQGREYYQAPLIRADDTAFLQYTSGSTGIPKGVVLTHHNLLSNIRADGEHIRADQRDVFVSWLPLYHDMGLIGAWLGSLYYSVPLVCMSPLRFLSRPRNWLWAIHQYQGTLSAAPNFAYELCLTKIRDKDIEGLDLSSWRVAFNGAEAVSARTVQRFTERFAPYGFRAETMYPVYGLAECTVGLAFPPLGLKPVIDCVDRQKLMTEDRAVKREATSKEAVDYVYCGRPLAGHAIRIVDANNRELPDRHVGNLQFRGPSATSGYFEQVEKTRELFCDDWLKSGDRAYTVNGDIFITGRQKDLIIRGGRNIYPEELEEAIGEVAGIRRGRVAVFGSLDPESATERLIIVAEGRTRNIESHHALISQISALAVDLLGTPPDEVVIAPAGTVLKTSSGKLRRGDCRKLYQAGAIGKPRKSLWLQLTKLGLQGAKPQAKRVVNTIREYLYAGWCWSCLGVLGAISVIVTSVGSNLRHRWRFIHRVVRLFAKLTATPFDVQGVENLPVDKPSVIVANHGSYLDGIIVVGAIPQPFSFVAKIELERASIIGHFLKRIDVLFVDRGRVRNAAEEARRLAESVRGKSSIMFFPEGTFYRNPGVLPFRMGAFVTAMENEMAVVPVAIQGTRDILRANSWFPRRGAISVRIGKPIYPDAVEDTQKERWTGAVRLRRKAREFIVEHCAESDLTASGSVVQILK